MIDLLSWDNVLDIVVLSFIVGIFMSIGMGIGSRIIPFKRTTDITYDNLDKKNRKR